SRVVGGTGVQPGAWPGIVSIQATWKNGTWHMCSGVLLSFQWVLTVAHCFIRAGPWLCSLSPLSPSGTSNGGAATNLSELGPGAMVHPIKRILIHQHYRAGSERNNIALLELDQPVECSDYIQLGCVPDTSVRVSDLKSCYIAGWSFATPGALGPNVVLQEAKVHLMDTRLCNSSRWYGGAVHPENLGAGLICKDKRADYFWLVGLSSWGRGCDKARHPGIYTSTQHFYNWI
ncbi:Acrosin, partial [Manacus vitellinus]